MAIVVVRAHRAPRRWPSRCSLAGPSITLLGNNALRPFTLEDTRNYLHFHLQRAEVDAALLTDDACRKLFHASQGKPRHVNQLALHALITAAAQGRDAIDGRFMQQTIAAHPLYRSSASSEPEA